MEAADLYRLLENPSLLSETTLPEVEKLVKEYPYFHTARLLYLKNLVVLDDRRWKNEVKKMAVNVRDRRKLFVLLEGEKYGLKLPEVGEKTASGEDAFSLIDAFLSSSSDAKDDGEETAQDTSLLFHPSASTDYLHWSSSTWEEKEKEEGKTPVPPLQHQDLIDSFLREEEQNPAVSRINLPLNNTAQEVNDVPDKPEENVDEAHSKSLDDSYFTETLARIYVKQKRYEKALQIIKNLSLKYPEKNVYFADQIRFLEKLIINTKK